MGKLSTEAKYGIIALFALATYGIAAFNLTLAGDDWYYLYDPEAMRLWFLQIDRWMALPLWDLFYQNRITAPLSIVLLLVALVFSGLRLCALLRISDPWQQVILCCLLLSCPVLIEHVQFKINHVQLAFAVPASVLSLETLRSTGKRPALRLLPVVLLTLAVGTLQVSAILFAALAVFLLIDRLAKGDDPAIEARHLLVAALTGVLAVVAALSIGALLKSILSVPAVPGEDIHALHLVSDMTELSENLKILALYLKTFYLGAQIGWPLAAKVVFLLFATVFLATLMSRVGPLYRKAVVLILFAAFLLLPFSLGLLRTSWSSYRYTAMFPLMLVYPLVIGVVLRELSGSRFYKALIALAVFVLLQFSQNHNHAAIATWANNERDRFEAARIYDALRAHMDDRVTRIHVVGRIATPRSAPFALPLPGTTPPLGQAFIINECAVLTCQPRHLMNAIRSVSYFPLAVEITEVKPGAYATSHPDGPAPTAFWPSSEAVQRDGENLYLFLSP